MSYGKVLTVALLGGTLLVGCGKKDQPTPAIRNPDGSINQDALNQAKAMEKKDGMSNAATTQGTAAKNDLSNGMTNLKDSAMNGMEAVKKDATASTMPSK